MRTHRKAALAGLGSAAAILSVVVGVGCATNPAPAGWLPPSRDLQWNVHGGWIRLRCGDKKMPPCAEGELIALEPDAIVVLQEAGLIRVRRRAIGKAVLVTHRGAADATAAWSVLGTLSTLSHGILLVVSAPVWMLTGAATTASEAGSARLEHPPRALEAFRPYARFPQGMPEAFERLVVRTVD